MPDDPTQQDVVTPLTTEGRLGGIARESLVADTGRPKLAGLVREALLVGIGLAGQAAAKSWAKGSVSAVSMGVTLGGTIATTSRARAGGVSIFPLAGRIKTQSIGIAFIPQHITVAGRSATMGRARLAQLGQTLGGGRIATQAKARGSVNLALVPVSRQWATIINTG